MFAELSSRMNDISWFGAIEKSLLDLRPDLAGRIVQNETRPLLHVMCGSSQSVGAGRGRIRHYPVWFVSDPNPGSGATCVPATFGAAPVAQCMVARLDAWETGSPIASPWRWDEPEQSEITRLADALTSRGVEISVVVGVNRFERDFRRPLESEPPPLAKSGGGNWLHAAGNKRELRVAIRPQLGWTVDLVHEQWRDRLDLAAILGQQRERPGVPKTSVTVDEVVAVARGLLEEDQSLSVPPRPRPPDTDALEPATEFLLDWMRWIGFSDVAMETSPRARDFAFRSDEVGVHFHRAGRPANLAAVQRHVGVALVDGKLPMMFSTQGYTRDAQEWSNRAGAALFSTGRGGDEVYGANALGEELVP